jgi:leucyl/phenylalanyl-tRNA--protein transferase
MAISTAPHLNLLRLIGEAPYAVRQGLLGVSYLLVPRRLPGLLPLTLRTLRDVPFIRTPLLPSPAEALASPDGLCGLTGRIGVEELVEGYRRGMFVMSHIGPLKWWAPEHRMVLFFDQARIEKSTRRLLRNGKFRVTFDNAFAEVMKGCATPRAGGTPLTWITPRIRSLFERAHAAGHAHSVEVWQDGELVGGAFGLAAGRAFFTESQFHTVRDASKVGFSVLNRHLQAWGFGLNDGKHPTRFLADCGMRPVRRREFSRLTETFGSMPGRIGRWNIDPALINGEWKPAGAGGVSMQDALPNGSECRWSIEELLSEHRSNTW